MTKDDGLRFEIGGSKVTDFSPDTDTFKWLRTPMISVSTVSVSVKSIKLLNARRHARETIDNRGSGS